MKKDKQIKIKPYEEAWSRIHGHYLLGSVSQRVSLVLSDIHESRSVPFNSNAFGYLVIVENTQAHFYINKDLKLDEEEWYFVFATILIVLGLDLYKKLQVSKEKAYDNPIPTYDIMQENAIFLFAINYVSSILNIQDCPKKWVEFIKVKEEVSFKTETAIYEQLKDNSKLKTILSSFNLLTENKHSIFFEKEKFSYGRWKTEFADVFAENLLSQAKKTIQLRTNQNVSEQDREKQNTLSNKAQKWFVNHYPMLSALAAQFEIIEDIKICQRRGIQIAAVSAIEKTIFINPLAGLNEQGMRFVIAHEILHIALNHMSRQNGRNHLTWNLACDFVINHWLVTMNVGIPPSNIYMDKTLAGKSAEEIYLMINQDIRLKKKMGTLKDTEAGQAKGNNGCDMLDTDPKYFSEFEDACKETLLRGVFLHETMGRGDLPADLVEEIKAINQPAIPWQVGLARWIAERFPLEESRKTYARPSRRQSSTPDIPRPRYVRPDEDKMTRTFGVLLDTSGSMDRQLLGKCLGAIASYSAAQEVKYIRLIFCDAQPYDEGYVSVDILAQKVKVKGRGGTVLQQAVNYLENKEDFPDDAPILILTDGYFEEDLEIKRDHAFLVPNKTILPITPRGEVFEFK